MEDLKTAILLSKLRVLLIEETEKNNIIIAAPHHSPGGVEELPCPEHKAADENTAFIAKQIAEALEVSYIIACNYFIDPNKSPQTDYSIQIAKWQPKYLVEIHGHGGTGGKKPNGNEIEISCGTVERNDLSIKFAETLNSKLNNHPELSSIKAKGNFDNIYFRATQTATIIDERWIAFQIELPPLLRLSADKDLPASNDLFVAALIQTIQKVCTA